MIFYTPKLINSLYATNFAYKEGSLSNIFFGQLLLTVVSVNLTFRYLRIVIIPLNATAVFSMSIGSVVYTVWPYFDTLNIRQIVSFEIDAEQISQNVNLNPTACEVYYQIAQT